MNAKDKIDYLINSCKQNSQRFPHTLLITEDDSLSEQFSRDIARDMGTNIVAISADMVCSVGDMAGVLTSLKEGDVLLFQNINTLKKSVSKNFIDAITTLSFDLTIDSGPRTRYVQCKISKFTVIATSPFLTSLHRKLIGAFFCIIECEETKSLSVNYLIRYFSKLDISVSNEVSKKIATLASRRNINFESLAKNLFDYMMLSGIATNATLTLEIVNSYLEFSGIPDNNINTYSRQINPEVKREVWRRDNGQCVLCESKEKLEFDHIIPFFKGGSNTARNIQLLCEPCNRKKSSKI